MCKCGNIFPSTLLKLRSNQNFRLRGNEASYKSAKLQKTERANKAHINHVIDIDLYSTYIIRIAKEQFFPGRCFLGCLALCSSEQTQFMRFDAHMRQNHKRKLETLTHIRHFMFSNYIAENWILVWVHDMTISVKHFSTFVILAGVCHTFIRVTAFVQSATNHHLLVWLFELCLIIYIAELRCEENRMSHRCFYDSGLALPI